MFLIDDNSLCLEKFSIINILMKRRGILDNEDVGGRVGMRYWR